MEKFRAIPPGYMTVGEASKKMDVTVRTLQYYDREGLLSPSAESEGGRRLYTDRDIILLYRILSLKSLGFSLDDIKGRLTSMNTPAEIAEALSEQADAIRKKLESLSESLGEIEALRAEVLQMDSVDFSKYADIIVNLRMKNENYRMIKNMDNSLLDSFRGRFDMEQGKALMNEYSRLEKQATEYALKKVAPDGAEGQKFAAAFWAMVTEFTGGDMELLPKLMEAGNVGQSGNDTEKNAAFDFIGRSLDAYFARLGENPLEENT